jgi:glyceraldehyde 3-phosphate dehydrogenase
MPRIAINGFGRIGRNTLKAGFGKKGFNVVAINDLTDSETLAALLQNDSVHGRFSEKVRARKHSLIIGETKIPIYSERDPSKLPWKELKVDIVLECTGVFRTQEAANAHVEAGAKRVILSAPSKGGNVPTYVMGVNDKGIKKEKLAVIDNASCTTNCTAPVLAVMDEAFGVQKAMLSTIHAYTSTQRLIDAPHKDLRRARAAAVNIIPTTTGAAIAATDTIPKLKGKFDGMAFRVPVIDGSVTDFVFLTKKKVTVDQVNAAFLKASKTPRFKRILEVTDAPLVSSDIIGNSASAIVNTDLTMVVDGNMVKVVAWYDNEWGYSSRLAEMALQFSGR